MIPIMEYEIIKITLYICAIPQINHVLKSINFYQLCFLEYSKYNELARMLLV